MAKRKVPKREGRPKPPCPCASREKSGSLANSLTPVFVLECTATATAPNFKSNTRFRPSVTTGYYMHEPGASGLVLLQTGSLYVLERTKLPNFGYESRGASLATLVEEVEVTCDSCGGTFFVSEENYYFATVGEGKDNGGLDFSCPNCGKKIQIWFTCIHQPNKIIEYENIGASGATLLKGFGKRELSPGEKIYGLDESLLYLPEQKEIVTCLNAGILELIEEISRNPKILFKIEPRVFEELLKAVFSRHGFQVELTKKTRDGGRDLIAIRSDLGIRSKYLIECKRYAANRPVRVELVRSLYGVQMQEGANKSVLATTSYFTQDAKEFASRVATTEWAMALKDFNDIVLWISTTKTR